MTLIPDPLEPHRRAIDTRTGRLAPGVFLVPAGSCADPTAPTAAELDAAVRPELLVGYVTNLEELTP